MSLVAEFTVPAEEFALYETLREVRESTVEVERVVAHEAGWIVPYFWVSGGEYAAFEPAAADDPSIENLVRLDEVEGAALYRGEWIEDVETVAYAFTQAGAALLDATGRDGRWRLQLRFDERADCSRFRTHVAADGMSVDLHRLYSPTQPRSSGTPGLTELQQETLVAALEGATTSCHGRSRWGSWRNDSASPNRRWPNGSGAVTGT
jgi:hypothetical protein